MGDIPKINWTKSCHHSRTVVLLCC